MKAAKIISIGLIFLGILTEKLPANHIDSLALALKTYQKNNPRPLDSKLLELNISLGKAYKEEGLTQEAIKAYQSALLYSKDDLSYFRIHRELGFLFRLQSNFPTAIEHCLLAQDRIPDASPAIPPNEIGENLHVLAQANVDLGRLDEALQAELQALELFESLEDSIGMALTYSGLGRIYYYSDEKGNALRNDLKAMRIRLKWGSLREKYAAFADVSSSYLELGKTDSAKHYAILAYHLARELEDPYAVAFIQSHMGEICMVDGDLDMAMEYIQLARIAFRQLNETFPIVESLYLMGEVLGKLGNYSDAIDTLHTGLELAKRINHPSLQKNISEKLSLYYQQVGRFKEAFLYQKEYKRFSDSIQGYEVQAKMAQLDQQYAFNRSIMEMEIQAQEQEVQNRTLYLILLGMGLLLLLVILFLLNYRYRLQKKAKELMELKNREIQVQHERIESANKDWQILADLIYKDIHEQVKSINNQLGEIQQRDQVALTNQEEETIDAIQEEMIHIDESLSHLENYIQAGITDEPSEIIHVGAIIKEARQSLPESYQGYCRKIFTFDLPPFQANRKKMCLMIQQILLFAIKNRGEDPLEVEVTSKPIDCPYTGEPEYLFSFKDNGIAIPKNKREEVFHLETFRENTNALHLGISKKILHLYNGHLWLDPDIEEGNIVHFVLPLSKVGIDSEDHPANVSKVEELPKLFPNFFQQVAQRVNMLFLGL